MSKVFCSAVTGRFRIQRGGQAIAHAVLTPNLSGAWHWVSMKPGAAACPAALMDCLLHDLLGAAEGRIGRQIRGTGLKGGAEPCYTGKDLILPPRKVVAFK